MITICTEKSLIDFAGKVTAREFSNPDQPPSLPHGGVGLKIIIGIILKIFPSGVIWFKTGDSFSCFKIIRSLKNRKVTKNRTQSCLMDHQHSALFHYPSDFRYRDKIPFGRNFGIRGNEDSFNNGNTCTKPPLVPDPPKLRILLRFGWLKVPFSHFFISL